MAEDLKTTIAEAIQKWNADDGNHWRHIGFGDQPMPGQQGQWADCAAWSEGMYCCTDPDHPGFNTLVEAIAKSIRSIESRPAEWLAFGSLVEVVRGAVRSWNDTAKSGFDHGEVILDDYDTEDFAVHLAQALQPLLDALGREEKLLKALSAIAEIDTARDSPNSAGWRAVVLYAVQAAQQALEVPRPSANG